MIQAWLIQFVVPASAVLEVTFDPDVHGIEVKRTIKAPHM